MDKLQKFDYMQGIEDKLQQLDGDALGALHADGHLMPIFMAVASLSNLSELVERKNRREARG